jgi:hypothetical protein
MGVRMMSAKTVDNPKGDNATTLVLLLFSAVDMEGHVREIFRSLADAQQLHAEIVEEIIELVNNQSSWSTHQPVRSSNSSLLSD